MATNDFPKVENGMHVTQTCQGPCEDVLFASVEGQSVAPVAPAAPIDIYVGPDDDDQFSLLTLALAGGVIKGRESVPEKSAPAMTSALKELQEIGDSRSIEMIKRLDYLMFRCEDVDASLEAVDLAKQLGEKLAARGSHVNAIGLYDASVLMLQRAQNQLSNEILLHNFDGSFLKQPDSSTPVLKPSKITSDFLGPNMEQFLSAFFNPREADAIKWGWGITADSSPIAHLSNTRVQQIRAKALRKLRTAENRGLFKPELSSPAIDMARSEIAGAGASKPPTAAEAALGSRSSAERPEEGALKEFRAETMEKAKEGVRLEARKVEKETRKP